LHAEISTDHTRRVTKQQKCNNKPNFKMAQQGDNAATMKHYASKAKI
jgi:hypothetical protein